MLIPLLVLALRQQPLPDIPTARSPVVLTAATAPNGRDEYVNAPVIHVRPGQRLQVTLINAMTLPSREACVMDPCRQATNLHFHGMEVSPLGASDNVLGMLALPGDTLHYVVDVPADHPPGLFWYHPHAHGESDRQIDDGMSGAIVVDGIERIVPAVRGLRERVLILRHPPHEEWTINGVAMPAIDIAPGERQFWRIVNASGDGFVDLAIDSSSWQVVALDGVALGARERRGHVLVPPAGRLEAIVTGPAVRTALRTRQVDTGPDGDPSPAAVLAMLVPAGTPRVAASEPPESVSAPPVAQAALAAARQPPEAIVRFSEDEHGGFYINGRLFNPADGPMFTVRVGSYAHWRLINASHELHPFHIHQVHFLVMSDSLWLDTVNVPPQGSVDVVLDATRPVIRGLSVFHCHMIRHEDKGMMAKVLFK